MLPVKCNVPPTMYSTTGGSSTKMNITSIFWIGIVKQTSSKNSYSCCYLTILNNLLVGIRIGMAMSKPVRWAEAALNVNQSMWSWAHVDDTQVLTSCQIKGIINQQPVALGKFRQNKTDALTYGIWWWKFKLYLNKDHILMKIIRNCDQLYVQAHPQVQ